MARHLVIGNGKMLVNLDITVIFGISTFRLSASSTMWAAMLPVRRLDGRAIRWLEDSGLGIELDYIEDSLVTNVTARHGGLRTELQLNDGIHQRECIYLKRVVIRNHSERERESGCSSIMIS